MSSPLAAGGNLVLRYLNKNFFLLSNSSRQGTTLKFFLFPTVHRFLFKELVQTFLVSASFLLSLILIGRGLRMRDLFLGLEFSFVDAAMLFFYMVPMFLLMVLPISCMISVFLSFLRMSTDRELIALKAGGVSIYQLLTAPLVFSLGCLFLTLIISLHGISWGVGNFRSTVLEIANSRAKIVLRPGVFNRDMFGLTLFARKVDPVSGRLQQVIFEDSTRDAKSRITVLAPEGEIITDEKNGALVFHLLNGRMYRVDSGNISILEFEDYAVRLDLAKLFASVDLGEIRPKEMAWKELLRLDEAHGRSDATLRKVAVEIHKRFALPAACLVLGIFAVPLACIFEGVKRQLGVGLALVFFLIYYALFSVGITVGESGMLPAGLSLWLANIVFALLGGLGLYFAHKERSLSAFGTIQTLMARIAPLLRRMKEKA